MPHFLSSGRSSRVISNRRLMKGFSAILLTVVVGCSRAPEAPPTAVPAAKPAAPSAPAPAPTSAPAAAATAPAAAAAPPAGKPSPPQRAKGRGVGRRQDRE